MLTALREIFPSMWFLMKKTQRHHLRWKYNGKKLDNPEMSPAANIFSYRQ
jgi:hypothetical protein